MTRSDPPERAPVIHKVDVVHKSGSAPMLVRTGPQPLDVLQPENGETAPEIRGGRPNENGRDLYLQRQVCGAPSVTGTVLGAEGDDVLAIGFLKQRPQPSDFGLMLVPLATS